MRHLTIFLALLTAIIVGLASRSAFSAVEIGQVAPELIVSELNGEKFNLASERGKVVVINFWATWCSPCREEMPALDAFYRHYHAQGLVMIGVSADRPHDRSEVAKVMQSFSYPAAMIRDAQANGFGTPTTLPITFIVDAAGIVRAKLTPDETKVTEASLVAAVVSLLPSKPPS